MTTWQYTKSAPVGKHAGAGTSQYTRLHHNGIPMDRFSSRGRNTTRERAKVKADGSVWILEGGEERLLTPATNPVQTSVAEDTTDEIGARQVRQMRVWLINKLHEHNTADSQTPAVEAKPEVVEEPEAPAVEAKAQETSTATATRYRRRPHQYHGKSNDGNGKKKGNPRKKPKNGKKRRKRKMRW